MGRRIALLLALCLTLLTLASAAAAEPPAAPAPFAGYELVEVSYLLRAPDGALVRVTRHPAPDAPEGRPGSVSPPAGFRARPAIGMEGWLGAWLFRSPRLFTELSDYVRESWALIQRLLDYLGVVVLIAGTWVIWFLVRPALLGVPDRVAFLLLFVLVSGLWLYATGGYTSVAYALGLMLLPAAVLGALSWLARRAWAALRGAG